jgi:hypothetical protein
VDEDDPNDRDPVLTKFTDQFLIQFLLQSHLGRVGYLRTPREPIDIFKNENHYVSVLEHHKNREHCIKHVNNIEMMMT